MSIQIVDDDEKNRTGLSAYLRSHGFEVTESTSENATLARSVDAVLAGYRLPEGVLQTLIESRKVSHPKSPVIVLISGSMDLPFSRHDIDTVNVRESTGDLLRLLRTRTDRPTRCPK